MKVNADRSGLSRRTLIQAVLAGSVGAAGIPRAVAAGPVEIDFWDMSWGPQEYLGAAEQLVSEFNSTQSDIRVRYRSVAWDSWYETYVMAIAADSAPDISTGGGFQAVQFHSMGAIYPLDELFTEMEADGSIRDYPAAALETVKFDGHYIALPWANDIRTFLYRKDLLDAAGVSPPTTWEEFRQAARTLTKDGKYGIASSGDTSGVHWILTVALNNGGGLFDQDRKPAITGDRTMEALQFLHALVQDGSVNPSSAGYSSDDAFGAFMRGDAAFILDNPSVPDFNGAPKDKIGVLPPLKAPHGDYGTANFTNNIMVYKQSKHPKETLQFLKWWSQKQLPLWTAGHAGVLPVRKSLLQSEFFQSNPTIKYTIDKYVPIGKPMYANASEIFPQMNEVDGDGFLRTLIQRIWQGEEPGEPAADAQAHLLEIMGK
ncbi:ABC transporter substrate-binding protein [Inquilinus sp. CA228]|uniref:ABC transporter substrate-binding protein n=1 Tax=Inquilinus sp. CA228 TaxID=3455609 RepID=UPI003F8D82B3